MPTTKRRLNITLDPEMERALSILSKRDKVPEATKVIQLLERAIEIEEDAIWSAIGEDRLKKTKKWLSHDEVWK